MEYLSINLNIMYKQLWRLLRRYKPYIVIICLVLSGFLLLCFVSSAQTASQSAPTENQVALQVDSTASIESIEPTEIMIKKADVEMLAKLIWGEARGVRSTEQKAAVVWCVLNRVDSPLYPDSIETVVTQEYQFSGYKEYYPLIDEHIEIAEDVLARWYQEKTGIIDVGRVLPKEYLYLVGDGFINYFSKEWKSQDYYDWSLPSPYQN